MKIDALKKIIKEETNRALQLREDTPIDVNAPMLRKMVNEAYQQVTTEVAERAGKINESLLQLRETLIPQMMMRTREMGADFQPAREKRVQLETVSKLIGVPVNELMLHFLNNVKTANERQLVEYRLGHVYFYTN